MDDDPPTDERPVPWLGARVEFPAPESARDDGLLAVGGDLSVGRLLSAYREGIFPWFEPGGPILWWSPADRLVLDPAGLKVSRSLRAVLRKGTYSTTFDTAFRRVIRACAVTPRHGEDGSWITPEVEEGYSALHELGYGHSVESWVGGELVGGLYGVLLGRCFFGESMFSLRSDASKVALVGLSKKLLGLDVGLIDCQVPTDHLLGLGAELISREDFLRQLRDGLTFPTPVGPWTEQDGAGMS